MTDELWQLYDEQGRPLAGKGETKNAVFTKGLLHGAAHVWMWRSGDNGPEVLLQKRAASKRTWPNCYDISAAGHIDLGEEPLDAAIRETKEEIGLDITEDQFKLIGVERAHMMAPTGDLENEFEWLYLLHIPNETVFTMQEIEVASVEWKPLGDFKQETTGQAVNYVTHGERYYTLVAEEIERAAADK